MGLAHVPSTVAVAVALLLVLLVSERGTVTLLTNPPASTPRTVYEYVLDEKIQNTGTAQHSTCSRVTWSSGCFQALFVPCWFKHLHDTGEYKGCTYQTAPLSISELMVQLRIVGPPLLLLTH